MGTEKRETDALLCSAVKALFREQRSNRTTAAAEEARVYRFEEMTDLVVRNVDEHAQKQEGKKRELTVWLICGITYRNVLNESAREYVSVADELSVLEDRSRKLSVNLILFGASGEDEEGFSGHK
ncbi:hypothetical protein R1flu_006921 [Riccia fluitans]|uniref:Uncharacterized protein n=1 Tax=Riccia fluitans TaxID=41844 RepID=A0ABD1Z0F5_9MARC